MSPAIDPRRGDIEDDASSSKRRSLLSLAGSLFAEISLPKLAVAFTLLGVVPALTLGIAPILAAIWFGKLSNQTSFLSDPLEGRRGAGHSGLDREVGIERLADLHHLLAGETAAGGELGDRFDLEAVHDVARDEDDAAGALSGSWSRSRPVPCTLCGGGGAPVAVDGWAHPRQRPGAALPERLFLLPFFSDVPFHL